MTTLALASIAFSACGGASSDSDPANPGKQLDATRLEFARGKAIECRVGSRPGYFVPGGPGVLVGCIQLGESGKRVEFSVHRDEIKRGPLACINPAYSGRGQKGFFIPAVCPLAPVEAGLRLLDIRVPNQGTPGYQRVIWGTIGPGEEVDVGFGGRRVDAAMIDVDERLASKAEIGRPFRIFVVELPKRTACERGAVEGGGRREEIPPRPGVCSDARV